MKLKNFVTISELNNGRILINNWIIKLKNFCWVSIFFDILIAYISGMVAPTPINHTIFWKSVMRTFRCVHVNYFNRLRFLAEVIINFKKYTFLGNLRTITLGENVETRQMAPFFSSTFSALTVCNIHFCIWN